MNDRDFYMGAIVALQVVYAHDQEVIAEEIIEMFGADELTHCSKTRERYVTQENQEDHPRDETEMRQGQYLTSDAIDRIILLLRDPDIEMPDIAIRLGCSRSVISAINRKQSIRPFNSRRTWQTKTDHKGVQSV